MNPLLSELQKRASIGAKHLKTPTPSREQYLEAVKFAYTAPDHGALHPAKILVIENREKLADFFESGALNQGLSPEDIAKARSKALKAPAIAALIVKIDENNPKVPAYEQWMTAGAFTVNFLMGLELQGFAGKIVSGSSTRYPDVVKAFCKGNEQVAAWIMIGTAENDTVCSQDRAQAEDYLNFFK